MMWRDAAPVRQGLGMDRADRPLAHFNPQPHYVQPEATETTRCEAQILGF